MYNHFDRLQAFLLKLPLLDMTGQQAAFMNEVMDCGGSYVSPDISAEASHLFEISLHGIVAYGACEEEALRNWKKVASAQLPLVEEDGFITVHPPLPNPARAECHGLKARVGVE